VLSETENKYDKVKDGVIVKNTFEGGGYNYQKCITINGIRYWIAFESSEPFVEGELEVHFGLTDTETNPITNAGLEVFGKIADEMTTMYEEIAKENVVKKFDVYASPDKYTKETFERIFQILEESPEKLNGLDLVDEETKTVVSVQNNVATVKTKNRFGISSTVNIDVNKNFLDELKYTGKVDVKYFLPELLNYIQDPQDVGNNKKQEQRLKLYKFYIKKRFPSFIINHKIQEEMQEPYLEVIC
jgi:hypothetical protein